MKTAQLVQEAWELERLALEVLERRASALELVQASVQVC